MSNLDRFEAALIVGATLLLSGCLRFEAPRCTEKSGCSGAQLCSPEGVCLDADPRCTFDAGVCGGRCAPCGRACVYTGAPDRIDTRECVDGRMKVRCLAGFIELGGACRPPLRKEEMIPSLLATRGPLWAIPTEVGGLAVAVIAQDGKQVRLFWRDPGAQAFTERVVFSRPDLDLDHLVLVEDAGARLNLLVVGARGVRESTIFHIVFEQGAWKEREIPGPAATSGLWGRVNHLEAVVRGGAIFALVEQDRPTSAFRRFATLRLIDGGWRVEEGPAEPGLGSVPRLLLDPETGDPHLFFSSSRNGDARLEWWRFDGERWQDRSFEIPGAPAEISELGAAMVPGMSVACLTLGDPSTEDLHREVALWPGRDPMLRPVAVIGKRTNTPSWTCQPIAGEYGKQVYVAYATGVVGSLLQLDAYGVDADTSGTVSLGEVAMLLNTPIRGFETGGTLHLFYLDAREGERGPLRHLWIDP